MGGKKPMNISHQTHHHHHSNSSNSSTSHSSSQKKPLSFDEMGLFDLGGFSTNLNTTTSNNTSNFNNTSNLNTKLNSTLPDYGCIGRSLLDQNELWSLPPSSSIVDGKVETIEQKNEDVIQQKVQELAQVIGSSLQEKLVPLIAKEETPLINSMQIANQQLQQMVQTLAQQVSTLTDKVGELSSTVKENLVPTCAKLKERGSTVEGRQSAMQSQLAQLQNKGYVERKREIANVVTHSLENVRSEMDHKLNSAIVKMESDIKVIRNNQNNGAQMENVHKMLTDLSAKVVYLNNTQSANLKKYEEKINREAKNRMNLEARFSNKFAQLEEWCQQLESSSSSYMDFHANNSTNNRNSEQKDELGIDKQELDKKIQDICASYYNNSNNNALLQQLQSHLKALQAEVKKNHHEGTEHQAMLELDCVSLHEKSDKNSSNLEGLKQILTKLMRQQNTAEGLLQEYVSTITHQVASVTRQYVSVRIQDNNRLLDATLRARIPDYVQNETEQFMLVRPMKKKDGEEVDSSSCNSSSNNINTSFVMKAENV